MTKNTIMTIAVGAVGVFLGQWLYAKFVSSQA